MTMTRIKTWRRRKSRKAGTLTCANCRTQGLHVLWEGDLCKSCYKPKPIPQLSYARLSVVRKTGAIPQSKTTLALKAECERLIEEHDLRAYQFARLIGKDRFCQSSFEKWRGGELATEGQQRMNKRIRDGIDQAFSAEAMELNELKSGELV